MTGPASAVVRRVPCPPRTRLGGSSPPQRRLADHVAHEPLYEFLFTAQPWSPTDGRTSRLEKEAQSAMGIRVSVRYHRYPKPRLLTNFH